MSDPGGWPMIPLGTAGVFLDDPEIAALLTPRAEIEAMLAVELALARAQHGLGEIAAKALDAIAAVCQAFEADPAPLIAGVARDGVIVPALVRAAKAQIGEPHAPSFHKGSTSQDIADTALMLRLQRAIGILTARLPGILAPLDRLAADHGTRPIMARTRYQDALPFTLADRIETWTAPLRALGTTPPQDFPLQLGGPIGLRAASYGPNHARIAAAMARDLGLSEPGRAWHTDRRPIAEVARWCTDLATALGKIGQDVSLMTQSPVAEISVPGGGSSAMAHKINPVGAEVLVALARHVAGHAATLQGAALHENERSGTAWTLEWLALPPILLGCGAGTRQAATLVGGMRPAKAEG